MHLFHITILLPLFCFGEQIYINVLTYTLSFKDRQTKAAVVGAIILCRVNKLSIVTFSRLQIETETEEQPCCSSIICLKLQFERRSHSMLAT